MQVNIGKGIELDVPAFATFAPEVQNHIVYIGLRNILMDSHAGVTTASANGGDVVAMSRAVAEKKLAALIAGELRTTSTREADPVKREAMRLAVDKIEAAIRAKGKKVADYDRKAINEKARGIMDKFMTQAKANVDAARAIEVDIDL